MIDDPFAEMDYTELREGLCKLPETWYPDLIRAMVEASYEKNVWLPGGCSIFVKKVEDRIGKGKSDVSSKKR